MHWWKLRSGNKKKVKQEIQKMITQERHNLKTSASRKQKAYAKTATEGRRRIEATRKDVSQAKSTQHKRQLYMPKLPLGDPLNVPG